MFVEMGQVASEILRPSVTRIASKTCVMRLAILLQDYEYDILLGILLLARSQLKALD
jgi:hypothetical protein